MTSASGDYEAAVPSEQLHAIMATYAKLWQPPPEEEDVMANSLQRSLAVQGRIHRCRFGKQRNIS